MNATCKTCPHWHGSEGSMKAACARNPPMLPGAGRPSHEAWPWTLPTDWCSEHPLRQRDRLAAMAMQGMLAHPDIDFRKIDTAPPLCAEFAYLFADAMLARRAAPSQEKTP